MRCIKYTLELHFPILVTFLTFGLEDIEAEYSAYLAWDGRSGCAVNKPA